MYVVTGATGKLGALAVEALLEKVRPNEIAVVVRSHEKAKAFAARGVEVRHGDYSAPDTLKSAFGAGERVLFISGSEVGQRAPQHLAVIEAAKQAKVGFLAYTSILHGEKTKMALAKEHLVTEDAIRASGVPFVFLRHGWYFENYTDHLGPALEHGAFLGSAKDGRISAATRGDYAAADVAALLAASQASEVLELAGDGGFTMNELAAEVSRQSGKEILYKDLPAVDYEGALVGMGLPAPFAHTLADADVGITRGELFDDSGTLRRLLGRPTTTLKDAVARGLAALSK